MGFFGGCHDEVGFDKRWTRALVGFVRSGKYSIMLSGKENCVLRRRVRQEDPISP